MHNKLAFGAIIVSTIAIVLTLSATKDSTESLADNVISTGVIRIGYVVYPPTLIKDPNTGALSGIAYDIAEQAAKNLGLETEWVEEVGWGSMIEGLRSGRYDMIGTLIWPNSARAREAAFSTPVMYSAVYPYARSGDTHFESDPARLNSDTVTLATLDGEMTTFIAQNDFPLAKTYALPQLSSVSELLLGVTSGKADVTFAEPAIANDFLKNNPGSIYRVGDTPIRIFGNVFAVARGEHEFLAMWNVALQELAFDGTIKRTIQKYAAEESYLPTAYPVGNNW